VTISDGGWLGRTTSRRDGLGDGLGDGVGDGVGDAVGSALTERVGDGPALGARRLWEVCAPLPHEAIDSGTSSSASNGGRGALTGPA